MKKKMPSEGLRLGRDSGSILCDTLKKWRFRTGWGVLFVSVCVHTLQFMCTYFVVV